MKESAFLPARSVVVILLPLMWLAQAAFADVPAPLRLSLPIDCVIGKECFIQNYVDDEPGPEFRDYNCGRLGYDGHKGTDFRLRNLARMKQGVAVLAAADGRVRAVRDEMPDISVREPGQKKRIKGREAGNSVVVVHGGGWETQYAHMRLGSIRVKAGDRVRAGQVIGLVGLSGMTEFPHVHLSVRYRGKTVDPFKGVDGGEECGVGIRPLWTPQALARLPYIPTGLLQAGFYPRRPDREAVESGRAADWRPDADAPAILFWIEAFGVHGQDRETFRLLGPAGEVLVEREGRIPRHKARWLSFTGRRRPLGGWPVGEYRGEYRLQRQDASGEWRTVLTLDRGFRIEK